MSIYQTLKDNIKEAMKSRSTTLTVLRTLDSTIQLKAKDSKEEITDGLVIDVLSKELKQQNESLEAAENAERLDLIDKANITINIIGNYLPKPLTDEEIEIIISDAITQTNASTIKDMGRAMGVIMPKVKGKANGKKVSAMVKEKLT